MAEFSWNADKIGNHHVQVFIPSVDREEKPILKGQDYWSEECLKLLGRLFGGSTAFPPARGVWYDEARSQLIYDQPVIVFSYASDQGLTDAAAKEIRQFLITMGEQTNQGEVGIFVDGDYIGIRTFQPEEKEGQIDD